VKGILLAGGTGSRLYPLTKVTNKHLLPVGREPMIFHPLRKLIEAGIHEILIVTGLEHMGAVVSLLGSGQDFASRFTYRVQDQAGGIAQALALAEDFVAGDQMVVILGDNIFEQPLISFVEAYRQQKSGARILLKQVPDPSRYGVAAFADGKITAILEKPETPPSDYAVTGVYGYDVQVFDFIRSLKPSARNELEISEVNAAYLKLGCLSHDLLSGWWTDAGTFESWYLANSFIFGKSDSEK